MTPNENAVVKAARALIAKLNAVQQSAEYRAVWASYYKQGGVYEGPQFDIDLAALKSALDYMDLHPAAQPRVDSSPLYPLNIASFGGSSRVHDYRMSDGTIQTMTEEAAQTMTAQSSNASGRVEIRGYYVSWQNGGRRKSRLFLDHEDAMDYYGWRASNDKCAPVKFSPLVAARATS
jgi:hypothetical protein